MIAYAFDRKALPVLSLSDHTLAHFRRYRQGSTSAKESGGQLFAGFGSDVIEIRRATGPRWSDRSTRYSFFPNRRAERREIRRLYRKGLHFVGDWHTHPEFHPKPSQRDKDSIREEFELSQHELPFLVLIIVGTSPIPEGLFVCVIDQGGIRELVPIRY